MAGSAHEDVLLEAWCPWCEASFDVWGFVYGGAIKVASVDRMRCPTCLVVSEQIKEKESLS